MAVLSFDECASDFVSLGTRSRNHARVGYQLVADLAGVISDSLPVISMNAEKAARQILDACRQGKAELVLTMPAQIAVLLHSLLPGGTIELLWAINRSPEARGYRTATSHGAGEYFMRFPLQL